MKKGFEFNFLNLFLFFFGLFLLLISYIFEFFYKGNLIFLFFGMIGLVLIYALFFNFFRNEKNNFKKSLKFIKEGKYFILFVIILFLLMAFVGYTFQTPEITEMIKKTIEQLIEKTKDLNFIEMFWFIFRNNLSVSIMSIIFGIFFSIFPLFTIISNGYVLGFVAEKSVSSLGVLSLFKLLPHGIFELPAIFLSIAFGLKLGMFIFSKNIEKNIKHVFKESIRTLVFVIIPLLLVAAIIETSLIFFIG